MAPAWTGWVTFFAASITIIIYIVRYVPPLLRFLEQNKSIVLKVGDIVFNILWFAILALVLYVGLQYHLMDAKWLLLIWVILYSFALSVLSTLRDYNIGKRCMVRAIYLTLVVPTFIALIGFWWAYWPNNFVWPNELLLPALATILFLLCFGIWGIYDWLKERW